MKIQLLFDELEKIKETSKLDFEISGMVNRFKEMKYGFFPLGWGILDENNKTDGLPPTDEIEEGGIMVLGNDFGTVNYVNAYVDNPDKKIGETDSRTIINFLNNIDLDKNKTFFTNFYLGVRINEDAKMTLRIEKLSDGYRKVCYEFFEKQLEFLKPKLVICLGCDVKNALISVGGSFKQWEPKSGTIRKLYTGDNIMYIIENIELKDTKFIIIPHPSYLINLLKPPYLEKLNAFLKSN